MPAAKKVVIRCVCKSAEFRGGIPIFRMLDPIRHQILLTVHGLRSGFSRQLLLNVENFFRRTHAEFLTNRFVSTQIIFIVLEFFLPSDQDRLLCLHVQLLALQLFFRFLQCLLCVFVRFGAGIGQHLLIAPFHLLPFKKGKGRERKLPEKLKIRQIKDLSGLPVPQLDIPGSLMAKAIGRFAKVGISMQQHGAVQLDHAGVD